jgi:multiple sugar transport system ATP-binding protein
VEGAVARLDVTSLVKTYDGRPALGPVSISVGDGEIVAVIGPSGCGKTTLLRLVAGLDRADSGSIALDDAPIDHLPPNKRRIGMVPEWDALPPQLTVRRSMRLPLDARGVRSAEAEARVEAEARDLAIGSLLDRRPGELSAGEQQLAQAARAVIARPRLLLLDEPLSRVDPARRDQLRRELLQLRSRHGVTTLWVTSEHQEAFAAGDRLVVLVAGLVRQQGTLRDLWDRPADTTMAAFVGEPPMNLIDCRVSAGAGGGFDLALGGGHVRVWTPLLADYVGGYVTLGVRPGDIELTDLPGGQEGVIDLVEHLLSGVRLTCQLAGGPAVAALVPASRHRRGDRVRLRVPGTAVHLFDPVSGEAVFHPVP